MKYTIWILLLLVSCTNQKRSDINQETTNEFFQINIENTESRKKTEYLSNVATDVKYVQLQNGKDCFINPNAKLFLATDSLIFVNNIYHVLKFSIDGKFIAQICNYGRGPGENEGIGSISIIPGKNQLAIQSSKKILIYSFNGEFIESLKIPAFSNIVFVDADRYIAYSGGILGYELYDYLLTNLHSDTIAYVENHYKWDNDGTRSIWRNYPYFKPFYQNIGRFYMKSMYNDTVYYVSENKLIPAYWINLGKYKMPPEWRPEKIMMQEPEKIELLLKKESECYYSNSFESNNMIYLTLVNFRTYKPKYFLFERGSVDSGSMLINEDQEAATIINDLDGGMDFWPEGKIKDHQLFMSLNVTDLKKKLNQNNASQQVEKITNAHEDFKKMVSDIDISANPVLMIVTLKN